jgi:hypothetical protein
MYIYAIPEALCILNTIHNGHQKGQSHFLKNNNCSAVRKFLAFYVKPESSLSCSQKLPTDSTLTQINLIHNPNFVF